MQMENKKKTGVVVLTSNKIDFKMKRQRRTLHNDKGNNPKRKYNPRKHVHTHIGTLKWPLESVNLNGLKEKDPQKYSHSWKFLHPIDFIR